MNLSRASTQTRKLLLLAPALCCSLAGAPNVETIQGRFHQAGQTAIEKQRASVGRQMARISESAGRRAQQSAESAFDRQRASIKRQRRSIEERQSSFEKQRASVERQLHAVQPENSLFTAVARPVPVVSWEVPADPECRRIPPAEIHAYVEQVAKRESLAPELLHVVIARESSFLPCRRVA